MKLEGGAERGLCVCITQDVTNKAELLDNHCIMRISIVVVAPLKDLRKMTTVDDKTIRIGKTALPQHGLFLKERPEWNSQ